MNCEICEKSLEHRKPKIHTNILQDIPQHYFCSLKCLEEWCHTIAKDIQSSELRRYCRYCRKAVPMDHICDDEPKKPKTAQCKYCGETFKLGQKRAYCSKECYERYYGHQKEKYIYKKHRKNNEGIYHENRIWK